MATLIDGKQIAADLYAELRPFFSAHRATLGIIVVGNNPVIESFVRIKTKAAEGLGIKMRRVDLPQDASTAGVIEALHALGGECDALIVQLPLPPQVDVNAVLCDIPPSQDVDALNLRHSNEHPVEAPVALAVMEILRRSGVDPKGKRTVVVGAGMLVGAPSAVALRKAGANVSKFTLEEGSITDLKEADIVVSGAGRPGLILPEDLKAGAVVIDAGASEQSGKVVGDVDSRCIDVASVLTPVPGGVGPVAVAMIFRNLRVLVERSRSRTARSDQGDMA